MFRGCLKKRQKATRIKRAPTCRKKHRHRHAMRLGRRLFRDSFYALWQTAQTAGDFEHPFRPWLLKREGKLVRPVPPPQPRTTSLHYGHRDCRRYHHPTQYPWQRAFCLVRWSSETASRSLSIYRALKQWRAARTARPELVMRYWYPQRPFSGVSRPPRTLRRWTTRPHKQPPIRHASHLGA